MASRAQLVEAFGKPGGGDALGEQLEQLLVRAREAWPSLEVDELSFVEHVAARLAPDAGLEQLQAADLYLAFACLLGDPAALEAFERTVVSRVPPVLGNLPPGVTADDILQKLRLKLFVRGAEAAPSISTYSGRGPLVPWLRASAVRVAQDFARRGQQEVATEDDALGDTPALAVDADVQLLKTRFAGDFKAAFQEALASLSPKDLSLLRLQYLDGVSPEEIGRIYQTHRTTVWRWLTQCREELLTRTKVALAARTHVAGNELSSLMNAVHSQLDVSISRMLGKR